MRGHVRGHGPTQSDRPYLIRAYERVAGEWVGEAWAGPVVVVSVGGSYTKAEALDYAERELRETFRKGVRIQGPTERPTGEVRTLARSPRGTVAAAWVPESSTTDERQARFAPPFVLDRAVVTECACGHEGDVHVGAGCGQCPCRDFEAKGAGLQLGGSR